MKSNRGGSARLGLIRLTMAVAAAAAAAGCSAGPSQTELAGYEKRLAPALGDILPAREPVGGKIALADAVSAPGSFLEIDRRVLAAGLRQRKIFEEVKDLGPEGTPAAAREAGFAFFLRFVQGPYRHRSVHHPEHRLARYALTDLSTGTVRTIDLNLDDHERVLAVDPGWARYDSGRRYGVDAGMKLKAVVEAVEREARGFVAARKPPVVEPLKPAVVDDPGK